MKNEVNKPKAYANTIMIPIYDCAYINKNKCYEEYDKSFAIISDILAKRDIKYKEWKEVSANGEEHGKDEFRDS